MFLGEVLLEWLLLAFCVAMFIGNLTSLLNPPKKQDDKHLRKAPFWMSFVYIIVGLVVAFSALRFGLFTVPVL